MSKTKTISVHQQRTLMQVNPSSSRSSSTRVSNLEPIAHSSSRKSNQQYSAGIALGHKNDHEMEKDIKGQRRRPGPGGEVKRGESNHLTEAENAKMGQNNNVPGLVNRRLDQGIRDNERKTSQVEVMVLSDSEDILPNDEKKEDKDPEPPRTPPRIDLRTYYKNSGISLSHVRRLNRNYVRYDGPSSEARGRVFWDSYSPPPGFTAEDVPLNDSQTQPKEVIISPAILNAEKYKYKPKDATLFSHSEAEFQDLFYKLTKRKAPEKENESSLEHEHPKKKSTPDNQILLTVSESLNNTFPNVADDMNDSELLMFTQAAELENNYTEEAGKVVITNIPQNSDNRSKTDFQGGTGGPINTSTPIDRPGIVGTFSNIGSETPKSVKSIGRNLRSNASTDSSKSTSSLFESSYVMPMSTKRNPSRDGIQSIVPRKSLFSESKSSGSPITSGDFADDDNDFLFSQMELPAFIVGENQSKTDFQLEKDVAEQSTQIINQSDSFLMHSDILKEIDKLEEMAIRNGKDTSSAGRLVSEIILADDAKKRNLQKSARRHRNQ